MNDDKLLSALKKGRRDALDRVMREYGGYVSVIVAGVAGGALPREDVEEAVADAFVALWRSAGALDETRANLRGYLAAIARNKARDRLRRLRGELPLPEDGGLLPGGEDPADEAVRRDEAEALRQLLLAMPEPDRTIFILHYYQGHTLAEISDALRLNLSTVKAKLARGREKLRVKLTEGREQHGS